MADFYSKDRFLQASFPLIVDCRGKNHIIPASLIMTNDKMYQASVSRTDFKEFRERVHFLIWQKGWQEIADHILEWLKSV